MTSRDERREQTRRRIYECALAVFRKDGVAACRIDDIAKAAGVSRGAFYFHFPTKEDVLLERMRETEVQICDALDGMPPSSPLEAVLARVAELLTSIWEPDPALLPDVASAALRYTATTLSDHESTPLRSTLTDRFTAAEKRGEIVSHLPPGMIADLYLGNALSGLLAWYGNPAVPLRGVLEGATYLLFNGVRAPAR
jgi:AcrR family transcriptional regulator